MEFLEKLMVANSEYEDSGTLTLPKFYIEISGMPKEMGGGFYVTIPALGRWFAQTDGATIVDALESLDALLADVITDDEHRETYKEKGITIP